MVNYRRIKKEKELMFLIRRKFIRKAKDPATSGERAGYLFVNRTFTGKLGQFATNGSLSESKFS